jgi:hypothetical protein
MFHRPLLLIAMLLLAALLLGLLAIGAFPPEMAPTQVERVIPNERFAPR